MTDLKDDLEALRIEREPERVGSRRWIGWTLLLALLVALGGAAWTFATRERPVEVELATVTERRAGVQAAVLNATGYVTARRRATVSSKVTGKVVEVNVEEGMAVREGQVLARLDDAVPQAALALAEAQEAAAREAVRELEVRLAEAGVTLDREEQLSADGLTTRAEVDRARAEVDSLEARIAASRTQVAVAERQVEVQATALDDTIIRAPFSGVAISKDAQPGEMVSPVSAGGGFTRTGISTIVDMSSLEIEVDVNESYINRVQEGQGVTAVLDAYPDLEIPARVITTVPAADRQTATVLVRIGFETLDPRILTDMGVQVTFLRDDEDLAEAPRAVPLVPQAAVRRDGDQAYVFVLAGDMVERRAITTGGLDGDRLEVLAGLRAGERAVVSPPDTLTDGALVQVGHLVSGAAAPDGAPIVRTHGVTKHFVRGSERVEVLQGVDIEVGKGEFLALMGPSGSGKTTLLNLIGGLDRPTGGTIEVAGVRISDLSGNALARWRSRNIGFVFQLYNLLPVLTAQRNVELPLLLTKLSAAERRKRAAIALKIVGLADRAKHYPRQLSGGQEQRVGIARAIVTDPTLLLCDEPTGDLDRKAGDEVLELLQTLNRELGTTILMVTHDPHAADRAGRTLHLDKGVLGEAAA